MIFATNKDPIEIKWECTDPTHLENEECPGRVYYWRSANEMHSMWRGPFDSVEEAFQMALDKYGWERER